MMMITRMIIIELIKGKHLKIMHRLKRVSFGKYLVPKGNIVVKLGLGAEDLVCLKQLKVFKKDCIYRIQSNVKKLEEIDTFLEMYNEN